MKKILLLVLLSVSMLSTGAKEDKPTIKFTGYKFTEKVGVSGTFKEVEWVYNKTNDLNELFKGIEVTVDTSSIDAGKVARNSNIKGSLFKYWEDRYITLKSKSYDLKKKTLTMALTIGEKTTELPFSYKKDGEGLLLTGQLDLLKLGYDNAFYALGKKCAAWHKGKDGKTKTWNTVDFEVSVPL